MKNKSKKLVVVLVILILLAMAVAYAAVSQTLTITGTARVAADVSQVIITNIEATDASGATDAIDTPTYTDTTATFDVTLAEPGAYTLYTVTIENQGNSSATLSSIEYFLGADATGTATTITDINAADPAGIEFEVTEPADTTLAAGASTTVTVKAYWSEEVPNIAADSSKTMTMQLVYGITQ